MGFRVSEICARKRAVHAKIIVDAVHRPDKKKKEQIKCRQKQKKKQLVRMAAKRRTGFFCGKR